MQRSPHGNGDGFVQIEEIRRYSEQVVREIELAVGRSISGSAPHTSHEFDANAPVETPP